MSVIRLFYNTYMLNRFFYKVQRYNKKMISFTAINKNGIVC